MKKEIIGPSTIHIKLSDGACFDMNVTPKVEVRELDRDEEHRILIRDFRHTFPGVDKPTVKNWEIVNLPDKITNKAKLKCQDCDSTKIKSIIKIGPTTRLLFCGRDGICTSHKSSTPVEDIDGVVFTATLHRGNTVQKLRDVKDGKSFTKCTDVVIK